jgi:hypothetical protein
MPNNNNTWAIILIVIVLAIFIGFLSVGLHKADRELERVMPAAEKAIFVKKLRYHGLTGFSVIEIRGRGLYFMRKGKLCRFQ